MRTMFDEQLELLNQELIKMGALCEVSISCAIKSLLENDEKMRQKAIDTDEQIDRAERDIEAICMRLLLQQQPVAKDLRTISSALKMISDMERIGDQSSDIAEITRHITDYDKSCMEDIKKMSEAVIRMLTMSIDSFVKKDIDLADQVFASDDEVDAYFNKTRQDIITRIASDSDHGGYYLDMLMIAKYLERIGDHSTNIAGWVKYSITGRH